MTTTETAVAVRSRQEGDSSAPAVNQKETQGIMARLGRWLERDHWPAPADTIALFSARLTDVAANKLAKQWSLRYSAAEAQERRVLLARSEEHTSELQSLMRISYAVFCFKK